MKQRHNPTARDFPRPPNPYDIDDVSPIVLTIENTRELYDLEQKILVTLAKIAVAGEYSGDHGAWEKLVRKAIREFVLIEKLRLPGTAEKSATEWYQRWSEWQLFGRGLGHLLRISQGDLDDV